MEKAIYSYLLIVVFFLTTQNKSYSANFEKDSLAEVLLNEVVRLNNADEMDSLFIVSQRLLATASTKGMKYYEGQSYRFIGSYYTYLNNVDSANYYYEESARCFIEFGDSLKAGEIYIRKAFNLNYSGKQEEALKYYNLGLVQLQHEDAPFWKGLVNDHVGFIYFKQGNYYLALKNYQKALEYFLQTEDYQNAGKIYNKIGITYRKTKDFAKEEEAYLLAINNLNKVDTVAELGLVFNNLSEMYLDKGKIKEGLKMLENAKEVYVKVNYPIGLCSYYAVLAYYYSQQNPPDNINIIKNCNLALPIALEYEDFRQFADISNFAGEAYLRMHKPNEALKILKKGLKYAEENNYRSEKLNITYTLSEVYEDLDQLNMALKYLETYASLKDSILDEDKLKEFTNLDLTFKFKQQQIKDSLKQEQISKDIVLKHETELHVQKQEKQILIFATILIVLITLFIFIYARRTTKLANVLNEKNKIINASLEEKVLLLEEVHHRVKNNFQLVSSLLEFQSKEIDDKKALKTISEGQNRVRAMALIHRKLYENKDIKNIDFKDYCTLLVNELKDLYSGNHDVNITLDIEDLFFDIDTAIPLGLIINELVTNALKYAFKLKTDNKLFLSITKDKHGKYLLIVKDNGTGIPENIDITKIKSLGLRLARRLSKQLHGTFEFYNDNGSVFKITFKNTIQRRELD